MTLDQLCRAVQGSFSVEQMPLPCPVEGQVPEACNVYLDGSVEPPARLERARAGVGAWLPGDAMPAVGLLPESAPFYFEDARGDSR
eukprot:5277172-Alexandrium_andersonii.AAC.1